MKIFTKAIFAVCSLTLFLAASNSASAYEVFEPTTNTMSQCKGSRSGEIMDLSWHITYADGVLSVTWIDVWANCCPADLKSSMERSDNNLFFDFQQIYGEEICDCICPFDVTSTYTGIEPGNYTFYFRKSYFDIYSKNIVLTEGLDITISMLESLGNLENAIMPTTSDNSGCKFHPYSGENSDLPGWRLVYNDAILTVKWINVWATCGNELISWIEREGDDCLIFHSKEIDTEYAALCDCAYDITGTYEGIKAGKYKVKFKSNNYEMYSSEIELSEGSDLDLMMSGIETPDTDNLAPVSYVAGSLIFNGEGTSMLEIFNPNGQLEVRLNVNGGSSLCVADLPAGVYIARVKDADGNTFTLRFVK